MTPHSSERDQVLNPEASGLALTTSIVVLYNLIWYRSYFPVTEGWFSAIAVSWLKGRVPYKDVALFLPPLYAWQLAVFHRIFGLGFLNLRILGVALMGALAASLYALFRRTASPFAACLAATISTMCFESFNVFIPYDFHTFDTLYAVLATLFLITAAEKESASPAAASRRLAAAGVFFSLCLLVKQSLGGLAAMAGFALLAASYARASARRRRSAAAAFVFGFAAPLIIFAVWLVTRSDPRGFYSSMVLGSAAKGSLRDILIGFFKRQFDRTFDRQIAEATLIFTGIFILGKIRTGRDAAPSRAAPAWIWVALALSLLAAVVGPITHGGNLFHFLFMPLPKTFVSTLLVPLALVATSWTWLSSGHALIRKGDLRAFAPFSIATLSCCLMYSTALSTVISAPGACLGLGIAICFAWTMLPNWLKAFAVVPFLLGYAWHAADAKYSRPYYWWAITSTDIRAPLAKFDSGPLRGILTTPGCKLAVEKTTELILRKSSPKDSIFVYPSIPIFYVLTDRWPVTRGLIHWYDVADDALVRGDLDILKRNPPKVIVALDLPPEAMKVHEDLFRGGRPSAQREMAAWIAAETAPHNPLHYALGENISLGDGASLKAWSR